MINVDFVKVCVRELCELEVSGTACPKDMHFLVRILSSMHAQCTG